MQVVVPAFQFSPVLRITSYTPVVILPSNFYLDPILLRNLSTDVVTWFVHTPLAPHRPWLLRNSPRMTLLEAPVS